MLGCYQNSNERKERNRTAARSIQYIHELRKMCVHISMCVWLFVCTFGGVRVLKYTRDAILYAPLCAHTYSHTFAGRMRKAAQEMKWKFCFLPVTAQSTPALPTARTSAPALITRLTAQLLATQFVTRQHCRRWERESCALFAQSALSSLAWKWDEFYLCTHSLCECVFIVLVSLFVYTGAQMAQLHT